jgi:hypothetical protein
MIKTLADLFKEVRIKVLSEDTCKCKRPKHQKWYVMGTKEEICARCICIIRRKK